MILTKPGVDDILKSILGYTSFLQSGGYILKYYINASYFSGITDYVFDAAVTLTLGKDELSISSRLYKLPTVVVTYPQITGIELKRETRVVSQGNDAVGSALVGGALFGVAGAVAGAVVGAGKEKTVTGEFIDIHYLASESEKMKILSFRMVGASVGKKKFLANLREKANVETADSTKRSKIKL